MSNGAPRRYDSNGDGLVSFGGIMRYVRSVLTCLRESSPEGLARLGGDVEGLARAAAVEAFSFAGKSELEQLTLKDFTAWYESSSLSRELVHAAEESAVGAIGASSALAAVREAAQLTEYPVEDVFRAFSARATGDQMVSREAFNSCMQEFIGARAPRDVVWFGRTVRVWLRFCFSVPVPVSCLALGARFVCTRALWVIEVCAFA